MTSGDSMFADIRTIFGGVVPKVFERMHASGELGEHWPDIRAVLVDPSPLSPAIVQALYVVFSTRCTSAYCFVLHSLSLASLGAKVDEIDMLAQLFDMPTIEPGHERWSRLLKLAWLSRAAGSHQAVADVLLRRECSGVEYERISQVYRSNRAINGHTVEPDLALDGEPMIGVFPPELQALVPDFVHFHTRLRGAEDRERPVSSMCSWCRQIRSVDRGWYPYEAARELLPEDVLFSHGICPSCAATDGLGDE